MCVLFIAKLLRFKDGWDLINRFNHSGCRFVLSRYFKEEQGKSSYIEQQPPFNDRK